MKILKTSLTGMLLMVCYWPVKAQTEKKILLTEPDYNKVKIFTDLPQKMELRTSDMEGLFDLAIGSQITTQLSDNFVYKGIVVSKSDEANTSYKSIIIKSTNRRGATFTFTKLITKNGIVSYAGRIISMNNGDALEIKYDNGKYYLQKKNLYDLINE